MIKNIYSLIYERRNVVFSPEIAHSFFARRIRNKFLQNKLIGRIYVMFLKCSLIIA